MRGRQAPRRGPTRARRPAPVIIAVGMSPPYRPASPADPSHHGTDATRPQLRSDTARGPRRIPAARQRPGRDDHRGAVAVPAHVELGRGVRGDRAGAAERRAGRRRTRHPALGAVDQRDDPAHRLRQRRRRILPRSRPVGDARRWPPTRRAPGTRRASRSRRCTPSRCSASSTMPAPAVGPPAPSPRRSSIADGPTLSAGTDGWPRPATRHRTAGSRSTTAGSPAWTTRRAGIAPTPT